MLQAPIATLRGTPTHVTAVELYQGHHGDGTGVCGRCGKRAPCPVRVYAASVIVAAGEDPRWYDGRLSSPATAPGARQQVADLRRLADPYADRSGYAIGGRAVPMDSAGSVYGRERE